MHISVMEIGAPYIEPWEEFLGGLQIRLLVFRRIELDLSWRLDLSSPFWRLYANNRSGAAMRYKGQLLALHPGRIYLIPPWVRFQTTITRRVTQDYIHFHWNGLPASLQCRIFNRPISLPLDSLLSGLCHRWREGFQNAHETAAALPQSQWALALVHAALATGAGRLSREERKICFGWMAASDDLLPALELIDRRLSDPPYNQELAELCGMSPDYFIRRFRAAVGLTPARYGMERRIAVAAQKLAGSALSIDEIADALGFTDRFHFSRVFKTSLGLPPAAYRHMHTRENKTRLD